MCDIHICKHSNSPFNPCQLTLTNPLLPEQVKFFFYVATKRCSHFLTKPKTKPLPPRPRYT